MKIGQKMSFFCLNPLSPSSGQYRKEQQHPDGSVTGTYGWVDPKGVLRLFDYISDTGGYRIQRKRLFKVGKPVAGGYLVSSIRAW